MYVMFPLKAWRTTAFIIEEDFVVDVTNVARGQGGFKAEVRPLSRKRACALV